ncbi:hypothetical protein SESBI_14451 [Sesbania bispinosa]|nr:hypothetical protein SESBI_14451 [Sesbania bispinosa]
MIPQFFYKGKSTNNIVRVEEIEVVDIDILKGSSSNDGDYDAESKGENFGNEAFVDEIDEDGANYNMDPNEQENRSNVRIATTSRNQKATDVVDFEDEDGDIDDLNSSTSTKDEDQP